MQIANVISTDCQQRVHSMKDSIKEQPIKTHEEVIHDRAIIDSVSLRQAEWIAYGDGLVLGYAIAAILFSDDETF